MSSIVPKIIGITVGLLLCATIMIPTISENLFKTEEELTEVVYYATTDYSEGIEYTVSNSKLTFNGTEMNTAPANILSDKFKAIFGNGKLSILEGDTANLNNVTSISIDGDGNYSYVISGVTTSGASPVNEFVGPAPTGDYAMVSYSVTATINTDAVIYGENNAEITDGETTYNAVQYWSVFKGTYDNMESIGGCIIGGSEITGTMTPATLESTTNGLRTIYPNGTADYTFGNFTGTATKAFYFVPVEYTYETSENTAWNSLLLMIPVLIIPAFLIAAVGMVVRRD